MEIKYLLKLLYKMHKIPVNGKGDVVKPGFTTSPFPYSGRSEPEISSVILFDQP